MPVSISRPSSGPTWLPEDNRGLPLSGLVAWQGYGGNSKAHPARANPRRLEISLNSSPATPSVLRLVGVFGVYGPSNSCVPCARLTFGAELRDLMWGIHIRDPRDLVPIDAQNGDGTSIRSLGLVPLGQRTYRVDELSFELPADLGCGSIVLQIIEPIGIWVFDAVLDVPAPAVCPFHSQGGRVSLEELPVVIRLRDRNRFQHALEQLDQSIAAAGDLDEAKGLALTFVAIVVSATLEIGASRDRHRTLLEVARSIDQLESSEQILKFTYDILQQTTEGVMSPYGSHTDALVDQAMAWLERNFASSVSDKQMADHLGLSTSHFRFLFRKATGQPFYQYLLTLRLERARALLTEGKLSVAQVSKAVGFRSSAHFSRTFHKRFEMAPMELHGRS